MRFLVIGIAGRASAGKTTLARMVATRLEEVAKVRVFISPFAAPVKRIAAEMGWNGAKDAKGRRLLQLIGTDCGRECVHPNIWVDMWMEETFTQSNCNHGHAVIADDVRFPNEAHAIREQCGYIIHIERPQTWRRWFRSLFAHASERHAIDADFYVKNNGTLEHLENEAALIVATIVKKESEWR